METLTKALSLPTQTEMLTACQRPERGCVLFTPKSKRESDTTTEARDHLETESRTNVLDDSRLRVRPDVGGQCTEVSVLKVKRQKTILTENTSLTS